MTPIILVCLTLLPSGSPQASPSPAAGLSSYLREAFRQVSANVVAAAEMMDERDYGFRPAGVADEVRTFAQLIGHTLEVNSFVCAAAAGSRDPLTGVDGDQIGEKARLLALLRQSVADCDRFLAAQTDASLLETVTTTGTDGVRRALIRANSVVFAIAHANEHYGNIVTYLRARGLVPPQRPAQVAWRFAAPAGGGR